MESKGLKYATINYEEPPTLVDAFKGVEVVISTVGFAACGQQKQLARAAKEAGVKLFSPSEYGNQSHMVTHALHLAKKEIQDYLKEIGLPYTLFYTGIFSDFYFDPYACMSPLPVCASFSNPMILVSMDGILLAERLPTVPPTNLSPSLLVRTLRGSSPMCLRSFLPLDRSGVSSAWRENVP